VIKWNTIQTYIEAIEEYIRNDVKTHGRMQRAIVGRERVGERADGLGNMIVALSNHLALELGIGGDPNITLLQCMSMISYAWMIFIIQAKSNAPQRYPQEALDYMKEKVLEYPLVFQAIHEEAVRLGNEYNVDNPKWLAAAKEGEAQQKILVETGVPTINNGGERK